MGVGIGCKREAAWLSMQLLHTHTRTLRVAAGAFVFRCSGVATRRCRVIYFLYQ
jgi:hypothetical protein